VLLLYFLRFCFTGSLDNPASGSIILAIISIVSARHPEARTRIGTTFGPFRRVVQLARSGACAHDEEARVVLFGKFNDDRHELPTSVSVDAVGEVGYRVVAPDVVCANVVVSIWGDGGNVHRGGEICVQGVASSNGVVNDNAEEIVDRKALNSGRIHGVAVVEEDRCAPQLRLYGAFEMIDWTSHSYCIICPGGCRNRQERDH